MKNMHFKPTNFYDIFFLFIILSILTVACNDEIDSPNQLDFPQDFEFSHSEFVGNIEYYDSTGKLTNNNSPAFIKNDFLFYDGYIYPYEKIKIMEDSSVNLYYTLQEITSSDAGQVAYHNDSLFFFLTMSSRSELIFVGYLDDNKLKIPAYGYKILFTNPGYSYSSYSKFGFPDIDKLIGNLNKYPERDGKLLIQKFELIYERIEDK